MALWDRQFSVEQSMKYSLRKDVKDGRSDCPQCVAFVCARSRCLEARRLVSTDRSTNVVGVCSDSQVI